MSSERHTFSKSAHISQKKSQISLWMAALFPCAPEPTQKHGTCVCVWIWELLMHHRTREKKKRNGRKSQRKHNFLQKLITERRCVCVCLKWNPCLHMPSSPKNKSKNQKILLIWVLRHWPHAEEMKKCVSMKGFFHRHTLRLRTPYIPSKYVFLFEFILSNRPHSYHIHTGDEVRVWVCIQTKDRCVCVCLCVCVSMSGVIVFACPLPQVKKYS